MEREKRLHYKREKNIEGWLIGEKRESIWSTGGSGGKKDKGSLPCMTRGGKGKTKYWRKTNY